MIGCDLEPQMPSSGTLVCSVKFVLQLYEEIMSRPVDSLMATYKPVVEEHHFSCWTITATKCHILASEGSERQTCVLIFPIYVT